MFIGLTSIFVLVVFIILGFNSLLNRNEKAQKNFTVAGIALFLLIISLALNSSPEEKASLEQKPILTAEYNGLKVTVNSYKVGKNKVTGKPKMYINMTFENTADYMFLVNYYSDQARVVDPNYGGSEIESGELQEGDIEAYILKEDAKEIEVSIGLYDMNKSKSKYFHVKFPLNK
jgi:hypothetical protein